MTEPTEAQIASACMSYRHDFGLMDGPERVALMHTARFWLEAWRKEFPAWPPRVAMPSADELAQIIRRVDGNHDLGAGALAEAILDALVQP